MVAKSGGHSCSHSDQQPLSFRDLGLLQLLDFWMGFALMERRCCYLTGDLPKDNHTAGPKQRMQPKCTKYFLSSFFASINQILAFRLVILNEKT